MNNNNYEKIIVEDENGLETLFSVVFAIKNILFSEDSEFLHKIFMLLEKSGCISRQKQTNFFSNYKGNVISVLNERYLRVGSDSTELKYRVIQYFDVDENDTHFKLKSNDIANINDNQILVFTSNNKKQIIPTRNRKVIYDDKKYHIPKDDVLEVYLSENWVSENKCY